MEQLSCISERLSSVPCRFTLAMKTNAGRDCCQYSAEANTLLWKIKKSLDVLKKVLLYSPTDGCLIKNQTSPFEACLKIQCLSEGVTSLFTQIPTAHIHISAFHNKDWWQEEENAIVYEIKGQRKRKGKDIYMKLYSKESPSVVLAFDALAFILAHNLTHGITIFWCWKDIYTQCYFWWLLKNIPSHAGI